MKHTFLVSLAISLIVVTLTGCSSNSFSSKYTETTTKINSRDDSKMTSTNSDIVSKVEQERKNELRLIISKISNERYNKLLTKSYSEDSLVKPFLYHTFNPNAGYAPMMQDVNQNCKIDCIRRKSDTSLYSIFKTDEGGLFYCYFSYYYGEWYLDHAIYMKKALTSEDFKNINTGDNVTDAEKIDPLVTVYKNLISITSPSQFDSYHLLKDGVMRLTYTKNASGDYIISNKEYSKDFILETDGVTSEKRTMDYRIFEDDYIQ